jgi:Schlafen, AlbA_2
MNNISELDIHARLRNLESDKYFVLMGNLNWAKTTECDKALAAKHLMALSNSGGGCIVYGAREGELLGLSAEEALSFNKFIINKYLKTQCDPEITCEVYKISAGKSGKTVIAITISDFRDEPIIAKQTLKDTKTNATIIEAGAIYVRTFTAKTIKADTVELMREILHSATNKKIRSLGLELNSEKPFAWELKEARKYFEQDRENIFANHGYWEIVCKPMHYEADRIELFELNNLFELAKQPQESFYFFKPSEFDFFPGGVQYLYKTQRAYETARIYKSGLFIWRSILQEDYGLNSITKENSQREIHLESALEMVTKFFTFASCFYETMDLECNLHIEVFLNNAMGRKLVSQPFYNISPNAKAKVNSVKMDKKIRPEQLGLIQKNASEMALELISLFNWRDVNEAIRAVNNISEAMSARYTKLCKNWRG